MKIVLIILFCLGYSAKSSYSQTIENPIIDLRDWNIAKNPIIKIEGQAEFVWQQLLTPSTFSQYANQADIFSFPGTWSGSLNNRALSENSFATYRINILLPENTPRLKVRFDRLTTASKIWINQKLVLQRGKLGKTAEETEPGASYSDYINLPDENKISIVIQIAGFHHKVGGIWTPQLIGEYQAMMNQQQRDVIQDFFLISTMLTMAIYHFMLFILRRKSKAPLIFACFLLLGIMRVISAHPGHILIHYFGGDFYANNFLEYLSFYAIVPVILFFIFYMYPYYLNHRVYKALAMISSSFIVAALITPVKVYSSLVIPFEVATCIGILLGSYVLMKACKDKRHGAKTIFLGASFLAIAAFIDILIALEQIRMPYLSGYAIYLFVVCWSLQLATIFTKSFREVELAEQKIRVLNKELEDHIHNLDHLVEVKTRKIRSIMENIPQGICILSNDGIHLSRELSYFMRDFLRSNQSPTLADIFKHSTLSAEKISQTQSSILAALNEPKLNFDLNEHLLVKDFEVLDGTEKKSIYEINWHPILNKNNLVCELLISLRDVTKVRKLQYTSQQKDLELKRIGEIIQIPPSRFQDFLVTTSKLQSQREKVQSLNKLNSQFSAGLLREVHTQKGIARALGLEDVSEIIHSLEDSLIENDPSHSIMNNKLGNLLKSYKTLTDTKLEFLFSEFPCNKQQDRDSYIQYFSLLYEIFNTQINEQQKSSLKNLMIYLYDKASLSLESLISKQISSLNEIAKDLNKTPPKVTIVDPGISFTQEAVKLLQNTFTHLLRNAIDHGIETGEEREKSGKSQQGKIEIEIIILPKKQGLMINMSDDGRGLNIGGIKEKAIAKGIIDKKSNYSPQEIAECIFTPKFSTKSSVSSISGRGIGMNSVLHLSRAHGCDITLQLLEHKSIEVDQYVPFKIQLKVTESMINRALWEKAASSIYLPDKLRDRIS